MENSWSKSHEDGEMGKVDLTSIVLFLTRLNVKHIFVTGFNVFF